MFIALLRPYEDLSINEVYIVDHETKGLKAFENDWEKCLSAEKKAHPEQWDADSVINRMEKKNWRFLPVTEVKVTY